VQETNVLRRLSHPCIVEFRGVGSLRTNTPDALRLGMYLVQEFMPGGTLKSLIFEDWSDVHSGKYAKHLYRRTDALRWAVSIASALDYLHTFSPIVVHRCGPRQWRGWTQMAFL
jgi:serine/threonine protein kinase